jgi:hypothetical protein
MPSNSVGTIAIWKNASAVAIVNLSLQDTGVRLRAIPGAGTTVDLPPAQPTDGDNYEIIDADGSSGPGNQVTIVPPAGTTIRGGATFVLQSPFSGVRVTFEANDDDWVVEQSTGGNAGSVLFPPLDVAAGTTENLVHGGQNNFVGFDGVAITYNLPVVPVAGDVVQIKMAQTGATPSIVNARGGANIEETNAPGTLAGVNGATSVSGPGGCVLFQFDKSTLSGAGGTWRVITSM